MILHQCAVDGLQPIMLGLQRPQFGLQVVEIATHVTVGVLDVFGLCQELTTGPPGYLGNDSVSGSMSWRVGRRRDRSRCRPGLRLIRGLLSGHQLNLERLFVGLERLFVSLKRVPGNDRNT